VQGKEGINLGAALGVAAREYQLPAGPCDYLPFVDRKAAGVIEAKPEGQTLTGVAGQSEKYMRALPPHLLAFAPDLLFDYEGTGTETLFRDVGDPHRRSRHLFAFHWPETLLEWASVSDTLRARLQRLPPLDPAQHQRLDGIKADHAACQGGGGRVRTDQGSAVVFLIARTIQ
jgi:type I restriction enzyme R subunit